MLNLSPDERIQIRKQLCFFHATSDVPGYGRFYSADPRFPCSIAVPGTPNFVYHRWDVEFLGVTFDIKGHEDVAVFRTDFKDLARRDSLANDVIRGRADEVAYAERFERDSYSAGASSRARIRRRTGRIAGFVAHRVAYANGWQRIFFMDSNYVMWNIHNRGIDDLTYNRIASSFGFLSRDYFADIASLM
jgi:hypothetical protein